MPDEIVVPPQPPILEQLMEKDEVCRLLSISPSTLNRIRREGHIKATWVGNVAKYKPSDVDRYLQLNTAKRQREARNVQEGREPRRDVTEEDE